MIASLRLAPATTLGRSEPLRMTSLTVRLRRAPSAPAGCRRAKSSRSKPRPCMTAAASASPMAWAAITLAIGAESSGQPSRSTEASSATSQSRPSGESGAPTMAISRMPRARRWGRIVVSSRVVPLLENRIPTSSRPTKPRSPWRASRELRYEAGTPIERSVPATFSAACPDLPTPSVTTLPSRSRSASGQRGRSRRPARRPGVPVPPRLPRPTSAPRPVVAGRSPCPL